MGKRSGVFGGGGGGWLICEVGAFETVAASYGVLRVPFRSGRRQMGGVVRKTQADVGDLEDLLSVGTYSVTLIRL